MAFFSDCSWRRMKSQPSSRMFVLICSLHKWHLIRRVLFQGFMMSFSAGSKSLFIQRRSQPGGTVSLSLGHMALCLVLLFSRLVVSDCLRPHGLQHARLACPSPSPGAYPNSCPLSLDVSPYNRLLLCHPLLLLPSIFPSVRAFSEWLFASGGQCIGASVSTSMNSTSFQWIFRVHFL